MSKVVRFRRSPYRFRVTENGVSVYKRYNKFGFDTEALVTPQLAGKLKKKYATDISEARASL